MKDLLRKALMVAAWSRTKEGRTDIGALVAVLTAIYTGLHRAGV